MSFMTEHIIGKSSEILLTLTTFILNQKCKTLKLDNHGDIKIGIDGEMFVMKDPTITVIPKAFQVIIPKP